MINYDMLTFRVKTGVVCEEVPVNGPRSNVLCDCGIAVGLKGNLTREPIKTNMSNKAG